MRRKNVFAVFVYILSVCMSPIAEASLLCKTSTVYVNDPNPPVNVRSSPEIRDDNVLLTLQNGRELHLLERHGNWFFISEGSNGIRGWVAAALVDWGCNTYQESVGAFPTVIKKRIPPMGEHIYYIQLNKGQKLSIKFDKLLLPPSPSGVFWRLLLSSSNDPQTKSVQKELAEKSPSSYWIIANAENPQSAMFQAPIKGKYVLFLEAYKKFGEYEITLDID